LRTRFVLNTILQFCFLLTGVTVLAAADGESLRYEVKADRRTGQLIRRAVFVTPRVIAPVVVSPGAASPSERSAEKKIDQMVREAANQYKVDPLLVHAVISVESNYNPHAVSPVGAQGLMQLMPGTARQLGVRNAFDAEENIRAGVKHLRDLQDQYKDDRLALAAYNAGAGAVKKYGWIPPYRETQDYVYKVGKKYGDARKALAANTNQTAAASPQPEVVQPPEHRPIEVFTDGEGRIHMRTK
jgi:soluble lytic murein transglycosylase-like protein